MNIAIKKNSSIKWLRLGIVLAAAAMILIGFMSGEADTVLRKAIYICMECIGLG